jgi:hypothetical protein
MRLAADTHDTFRRADLANSAPEMPGNLPSVYDASATPWTRSPKYLEEAKRVAGVYRNGLLEGTMNLLDRHDLRGTRRLYAVTRDRSAVRTSLISPGAAPAQRLALECDYGPARGWNTFGGLNADASGIDYIAAMEQYQCWYSLREYYRLTEGVLPP